MGKNVRRTSYWRVTRYQIPLMAMTVVPTFIFCLTGSIFILYAQRELIDYINITPNLQHTELVNAGGIYLLGIVWLFFGIVYSWARIVSGRMVGAFERIIREMDMCLDGGDIQAIQVRDRDFLAGELLYRINQFIQKSRSATPVPRMLKTTEAF